MNKKQLFYQSFLQLKTEAEVRRYLRDLLTNKEIDEFTDRLWIANLLDQKVVYESIVAQTQTSSRTIARVSKWLRNGKNGYRLVLDRLQHYHALSKPRL